MAKRIPCSVDDCGKPAKSDRRGLCNGHDQRQRRFGHPLGQAYRPSVEERFWSKVEKTETCWVWRAETTPEGYGHFMVNKSERPREGAHRFSWELAHGTRVPPGMDVCHRCDNPPCVNPDHLFVGTRADNMRDMAAKGRSLLGERHNMVKLTEDDVREIRRLYATGGITQAQLGRSFGVGSEAIVKIVRGHRWRHLLPDGWQPPADYRHTRSGWHR